MDEDFFEDEFLDDEFHDETPPSGALPVDDHIQGDNSLFGDEVIDFLLFREITGKNKRKSPKKQGGCLFALLLWLPLVLVARLLRS